MGDSVLSLLGAIIVLFLLSLFKPYASNHRFKRGDSVPLFVNKLAPFHDHRVTYRYYDLAFCSPVGVKENKETHGRVLNGDRLVAAPYKIHFLIDREPEIVCTKRLRREAVAQFKTAILKDFVFHMYLDDLPTLVFVGRFYNEADDYITGPSFLLYKHLQFEILYNGDRIIDFAVQNDPDKLVDLTEDKEIDIDFSFSVIWTKTDIPFKKRLEKDSETSLLHHLLEIPWFRIITSCFYIFLGIKLLIAVISRFRAFVMFFDGENEYSGWRHIRGDVFRYPRHKSLFAAAVGTGFQLVALALLAYILALAGMFHPDKRGTLLPAIFTIYAASSEIAGHTAVSFHYMIEGIDWVKTLLFTGCLFSGPLFLTICFLYIVAFAYNSTALLPFKARDVILLTLATSPLLIMGGVVGRYYRFKFEAPSRTSKVSMQIPRLPWYHRAPVHMVLAGLSPFKAISHNILVHIFASVWDHQIHTVFDNLFYVLMILFVFTAFSTVLFTCFQLVVEDHEWWWRSFLNGGSVSFFIYGYSFYFYFARSDISGFMQTSFFFGYVACICYGSFLMLGAVGFTASFIFVKSLYRTIHQD